jgi:glutaredoxin
MQGGLDADMGASDYSGGQTKLPKILLNGNNICMVRVLI